MERIPLHSWEMEFSIQYHVTINSQLNDQNSIRYYINYCYSTARVILLYIIRKRLKRVKFCTKYHSFKSIVWLYFVQMFSESQISKAVMMQSPAYIVILFLFIYWWLRPPNCYISLEKGYNCLETAIISNLIVWMNIVQGSSEYILKLSVPCSVGSTKYV
jgi:hypothetical protein